MQPRYELFDHTADVGVRVWAPSLPELLPPATEGLYAVIGEVVPGPGAAEQTYDLIGDDPALLLRDYLAEVLYLFERDKRRLTAVAVQEFTAHRLAMTGQTQPIATDRSSLEREVKAITYHELAIRSVENGYEATYIVDI